jgi:hypothetical protein
MFEDWTEAELRAAIRSLEEQLVSGVVTALSLSLRGFGLLP